MKRHEVKFTIAPGGDINMEVINGEGESCVMTTQELVLSLSNVGEEIDEGKKPEYYEGSGGISVFNDMF